MEQQTWNVIGMMSGTSLDGVDLVFVTFTFKERYAYKIHYAKTYFYTEDWRLKLQNAFYQSEAKISELNTAYGKFIGKLINTFIDEFSITEIDFIASHGHTIFHKPAEKYTLQIGDGKSIAKETNLKVVCDFRSQDVALGGQGAPLVPMGDMLLFADYAYCLNLGGFANISYQKNGERIAFDICPVNVVLNRYAEKLGKNYDENGHLSSEGTINYDLLRELNELPFYASSTPKSLGLEYVISEIIPVIERYEIADKDVLRTFVEHIAIKIAEKTEPQNQILITGGGAFNTFLIHRIKFHTHCSIKMPSEQLINFKEALIFAFLGVLRIENKNNCLKSVTGATKDHCSGVIFTP